MGRKQVKAARPPVIFATSAVLLVAGAVWLVLVLVYAGPMAAAAAYCVIVDGGVVVLWLAAAIGIGSWLLPLFLQGERNPDREGEAPAEPKLGR